MTSKQSLLALFFSSQYSQFLSSCHGLSWFSLVSLSPPPPWAHKFVCSSLTSMYLSFQYRPDQVVACIHPTHTFASFFLSFFLSLLVSFCQMPCMQPNPVYSHSVPQKCLTKESTTSSRETKAYACIYSCGDSKGIAVGRRPGSLDVIREHHAIVKYHAIVVPLGIIAGHAHPRQRKALDTLMWLGPRSRS